MSDISRRVWLGTLGVAPVAGAVVAWAESTRSGRASASGPKLSPRQRIQKKNLPNLELVTHDGRRVRFYDDLVKDKKVVINFMYAECEGICSPVTANLVQVQKMLGDRVGREIFFYSITLKPDEDTPAELQRYAQMHRVGPGWLFLTGQPADIELLRRALGFAFSDPAEDADKSNHTGMVRYGIEAEMRWGACPGMATPGHILRSIVWDLDAPIPSKAG